MTRVFKFGGASIKDAAAIRHLGELLGRFRGQPLVLVISAMGKTTNALEALLEARRNDRQDDYREGLERLRDDHLATVEMLFGTQAGEPGDRLRSLFSELDQRHHAYSHEARALHYDQTIGYGELLSTTIVAAWLEQTGIATRWLDARDLIITDACHQAANIDWPTTAQRLRELQVGHDELLVTQGFIGSTRDGLSTSLGREGSDFSAAIFAHCLDAEEATIWKDVEGLFNADPRRFDNAVLLTHLSYAETLELAWYGAKVIHPKTLAPLERKAIPLVVRSFETPDTPGSLIDGDTRDDGEHASCILCDEQTLLEIHPEGLAFMDEARQHHILGQLLEAGLHAGLIDSGARRLLLCLDSHPARLEPFIESLRVDYAVSRQDGLTLLTVRHPSTPLLTGLCEGREILAERRNATTAQYLFRTEACPETWHIPE